MPSSKACLHMHDPRDCHLAFLKQIVRYMHGTTALGLHVRASSSTILTLYSDVDWAGCLDTRRSTSGYCVFFGESLVSLSSKQQPTVSRSNVEAEYRAVANAAAECIWLPQLLGELHCTINTATVVFYNNVSVVYMTSNPVHLSPNESFISSANELLWVSFVFVMWLVRNSSPML
jgi:hypothetical protein